jgi:hypothetical protein
MSEILRSQSFDTQVKVLIIGDSGTRVNSLEMKP